MIHNSHKVIIILGPTASGKTEWGIKLARKFNGEIICADSRTVYKYLDIGTAKPKGNKCKDKGCLKVGGVRHYLLDFVEPKRVYTAANFQGDAFALIHKIKRRGKTPFVVGGSALYLYALTRNYQFAGKSDTKLHRELESKSLAELQAIIKNNKKIKLNRSDFQNKRRLIRAIEVNKKYKLKNKNFSNPIPYSFLKIGINLSREDVYRRIDGRTEDWVRLGLIDEVKSLLKMGISRERMREFGLGYREVVKYLNGEIKTKEELIRRINFCQHAYVRRQMTWFRKDKNILWCGDIQNAENKIRQFLVK